MTRIPLPLSPTSHLGRFYTLLGFLHQYYICQQGNHSTHGSSSCIDTYRACRAVQGMGSSHGSMHRFLQPMQVLNNCTQNRLLHSNLAAAAAAAAVQSSYKRAG